MGIADIVWSIPEFAINTTRQLRDFLFQPLGNTNIPVWGAIVGGTALVSVIVSIIKNLIK